MMLGRNVTLPLEAVVGKPPHPTEDRDVEPDEHIERLQKTLRDVHDLARKNLKKNADYNKRYYDIRAEKQLLDRGEPVWLYDNTRKVGGCQKLTTK